MTVRLQSLLLLAALVCVPGHAADGSESEELAALRALLQQQQAQIEQLRQILVQQDQKLEALTTRLDVASQGAPRLVEVATIAPLALPAAAFEPARETATVALAQADVPQSGQPAAANPATNGLAAQANVLQSQLDSITGGLNGFRLSGDFRYRLDLQLRSGNQFAAPLQNERGRYRLRLNVDKEIAPGLTTHAQFSTGPYNVETTNDQDFAGLATKHAFSIAEAWVRYSRNGLSIRGGRMEEAFADNMRFLWDDDVRFNGFDFRYERGLSRNTRLEFRTGQYFLTNPNTTLVQAGSPYLAIGYQLGQKVRDSMLFHPGFYLRTRGERWTSQFYGSFSWYRNANEISLASTAAGVPILVSNALGLALATPIQAAGNAVTTQGGAMLAARHYQIAHLGYRVDYQNVRMFGRTMPFWADFQSAMNVGAGSDRRAFMGSVNLGAIQKRGDVRYLYQYSYKQANSLISQFTDDDLGTGTGVNTRVHAFRMDIGLTRFLQWQNLLFVQNPITGNRSGFFVPLPSGANTTLRFLGQLAFNF